MIVFKPLIARAKNVSNESLIRLRPRADTIYVSKGRTVLATGRDGFLANGPEQGLFVYETRLLFRYRYLIDVPFEVRFVPEPDT